jgi:hypothetical protein
LEVSRLENLTSIAETGRFRLWIVSAVRIQRGWLNTILALESFAALRFGDAVERLPKEDITCQMAKSIHASGAAASTGRQTLTYFALTVRHAFPNINGISLIA